jgi:hypothetical protein
MGVRFIHLFEGASLTLKGVIDDFRKDLNFVSSNVPSGRRPVA